MCPRVSRRSSRPGVAVLAVALLIVSLAVPALPAAASTSVAAVAASVSAPTATFKIARAWLWLTSLLAGPALKSTTASPDPTPQPPDTTVGTNAANPQPSPVLPGGYNSDRDPDGYN